MNQDNNVNGQNNVNGVIAPTVGIGGTTTSVNTNPVSNDNLLVGKENLNNLNRPPESLIVNSQPVNNSNNIQNSGMQVNQANNMVVNQNVGDVKVNKINPSLIFNYFIDIFKKPIEFVNESLTKYSDKSNAIMLSIYISAFAIILALAAGFITGGFTRNYDFNTGSVTANYNFSNVFNHNFLSDIVVGFVSSFLLIYLVSFSYYILCYFKKIKMPFFKILTVASSCYGPFILGVNVIFPIISVFQAYVAVILSFIFVIFTLVVHITAINSLFSFKKPSDPIYFHVIALGIAFSLVLILAVVFLHDNISAISYGISIGI